MAGYQGQIAVIPLGTAGLLSDAPDTQVPPTSLTRADNATLYNSVLEKDFGSERWNTTALPTGIKTFHEYYPDPDELNQRVLVLGKNGNVYKFNFRYQWTLCTAATGSPATINANTYAQIVSGGNEVQNNPKKEFLFTGSSPIQVVTGDTSVRHTIANPAADWSGSNHPVCGVIHRGRLFAFGPASNPHAGYASSGTDHEDFTTLPLLYSIFPGEGQRIVCAIVFRSTLYVFKYPNGVYQLNDSDADPLKWYFTKFSNAFGAVSPASAKEVGQDVFVNQPTGSVISMQAALVFGDLETSDVMHQLKVFDFLDNEVRKDAYIDRYMIYYPSKQTIFISFQSNSNYFNDRICALNVKQSGAPAKVTWSNKDQPNCLGMIKDVQRVGRPAYGANDGYLYLMDRLDRIVGDPANNPSGYKFNCWTPDMDFSQGDALIAQKDKQFDQLQVEFQPTGDWDLMVDVYVDGRFSKTHRVPLKGYCELDTNFKLDTTRIDGYTSLTYNIPINAMGKKIAFNLYNSGVGQNVRLVCLRVFYQLGGDNNTRLKGA